MAPRSGSPRSGKAGSAKPSGKKPGTFEKGDPRINRTIPGSGRPKDSFKRWMRDQLKSPRTKKSVRKILRDPKHPQFTSVVSTLLAYTHAKPAAKVKHSGTLTLQEILAKSREFDEEQG